MARQRLREYHGIDEHNGAWAGETYIFRLRLPQARRQYSCDACLENILQGERYVSYVTRGLEMDIWEHWHIHIECYLSDQPMFEGKRPQEHLGLTD